MESVGMETVKAILKAYDELIIRVEKLEKEVYESKNNSKNNIRRNKKATRTR